MLVHLNGRPSANTLFDLIQLWAHKIRGECMKHEQRHNETHIHQSWRQEGQLTAVVTISIFVMSWKWHFYINIATVYCVDAQTSHKPFKWRSFSLLEFFFVQHIVGMCDSFICLFFGFWLLLDLMCCIHCSLPFAVCITHAMLYHTFFYLCSEW